MKIYLTVVLPGQSETQYSLTIETPIVPRVGEYVSVLRKMLDGATEDDIGTEDFLVKRVWWHYDYVDAGHAIYEDGEEPIGTIAGVSIQCEMVVSQFSSKAHATGAGKRARKII